MQNQGPTACQFIIMLLLWWVVIIAPTKPTDIYLENHTGHDLTITLTYYEPDIRASFSQWEFWKGQWLTRTCVVSAGDAAFISTLKGIGNQTVKVSARVFLGRQRTPLMNKVFDPACGFFRNSYRIEVLASDLVDDTPAIPSFYEPTPLGGLPRTTISDLFKKFEK